MKITVTQKHIDEGVQKSCHHCAVAKAVDEAINATGPYESYVGAVSIFWWIGEDSYRMKIPIHIKEWMTRFDSKLKVAPFTFELEEA